MGRQVFRCETHDVARALVTDKRVNQYRMLDTVEQLNEPGRIGNFMNISTCRQLLLTHGAGDGDARVIISGGRLTDSNDASQATLHSRSILSLRKCVEHEMHGS